MTDQTKTAASDAAGRALVDRAAFEKEAVWLPSMAVQHWNAGKTVIEDKTFTDCLIEGPGVVAVMGGTTFDNCAMGTTTDIRNLLYRPVSRTKLAGVIGLSNCRFVRCRFVQIGFTGSDEMLADFEKGIGLRSAAPGAEPEA